MKTFYRLSLMVALLFATVASLQAQEKYQPSDWGTGIDASTCTTTCSTQHLLGYVDFNYAGSETSPAAWQIADVGMYGMTGAENQSLTIKSGINYTGENDMTAGNSYTIVANPSSINAGENATNVSSLMDLSNNDGGFLILKGGGDDAFTYNISGLNGDGSDKARYCVRVRLYNPGTQINNDNDFCNGAGNNTKVVIKDAALVADGKFKVENTQGCATHIGTFPWTGRNDQNPDALKRYGDYTVFEGTVQLSSGRDNFTISVKPLDVHKNAIIAVASIEVWGCLPAKIEVLDEAGTALNTTSFCEAAPFTLKATGAGFGENIEWFKGSSEADALASASIGSGETLEGTAAAGAGTVEYYVAKGSLGQEVIAISSVFCCPNTVTVFTEDFPINPATAQFCGGVRMSDLSPGRGTTTYNFFTDCAAISDHARSPYAIVNNSGIAPWNTRTIVQEHSGTANSGAMLVNASDDITQYFYELELPICSATSYSFSAWYVSIANKGTEAPSNIQFEIWETDASGTPVAIIDGGASATGNFGGTSNDADNSSFEWRKHSIDFMTPPSVTAGTRYILRLKNHNGDSGGNDLLIDDILVTKCMPETNIGSGGVIGEIQTCSTLGIDLELNAAQADLDVIASGSATGNVYYQWAEVSETGTLVQLIGTVQELVPTEVATVKTPTVSAGDVLYYQVKMSSDPDRAADWAADLATSCGNDLKSIIFKATIEEGDHIASVTDGAICGTGPVALSATTEPEGGEINWYDAAEDGNLVGTTADGEAWNTPILSQTTTYYAELAGGDCPAPRTAVVATVNTVNTIAGDGNGNDRTLCLNSALSTNIVFNTTGATEATITGLPAGMSGVFTPSDAAVVPALGSVSISGTPTESGTFTYTVDVSNDCGVVTIGGTITVNPLPAVTAIEAQTICSGFAFTQVDLTSTPEGASFAWTVTQNGVDGATDGSGTSIPATVLTSTTGGEAVYSITPTLNACAGEVSTFTVRVNAIPAAPFATSVRYCVGAAAVPLTASGSNPQWYEDSTTETALPAAPTPLTGTTTDSRSYWVSQTVNGCTSPRTEVVVSIIDAMSIRLVATNEAGASMYNQTLPIKRGVHLEAVSISGEVPQTYTWQWNGTSEVSTDSQKWVYPMESTTYSVEAKIDEYCSASASVTINVKPMPNSFIPSMGTEDMNGVFPSAVDALDYDVIAFANLLVYNRYGQEVYNGAEGWDGTVNGGEVAAPGTYFYVLTFLDGETLQGTIEVIK